MEIIRRRERVETECYSLTFEWADMPGCGFGFDCDKDGNLLTKPEEMNPAARANYEMCLKGEDNGRKILSTGVTTYRNSYVEPSVGKCHCGAEVVLSGFTNTCDGCGADYNMSGQRLADRSQWGEETGESVDDILAIDGRSAEENLDGADY